MKNPQITNFSYENYPERNPLAVEKLSIKVNKLANINGDRMMFAPNLMNKTEYIPPKSKTRVTPIYISFDYTDIDSIIFHIPAEFIPEALPEPVNISSKFGEYKNSIILNNNKLIYYRYLRRYKGKYPNTDYNDFSEFIRNIAKADAMLVIFTKTKNN